VEGVFHRQQELEATEAQEAVASEALPVQAETVPPTWVVAVVAVERMVPHLRAATEARVWSSSGILKIILEVSRQDHQR
jgi:hypothetical protein